MGQKVIKIGSSVGVTLSKRMLDKLGLKLGDVIDIDFNTRKGVLEISKMRGDSPEDSDGIVSLVAKLAEEYQDQLSQLDD